MSRLVVGYVQSGKTLSFTTLISLARDNYYPLVILLAGTKKNLHEQTVGRLARDLRFERPGGMTPWYLLDNPTYTSATAETVAGQIKTLRDPTTPEMFRRTTVITVMKNPTRLGNVQKLLEALPDYDVSLDNLPVLIIDDEADQAGLNAAVRSDDETATYRAIIDLRDIFDQHSYVMYTATPQAPLLLNLADLLSPDFVTVLTPGLGYTGGRYFFKEHKRTFLHELTQAQVAEALDPTEPPTTLAQALGTYLLVRAIRTPQHMVSMLIHPSHGKGLQSIYGAFVQQLLKAWSGLLGTASADRDELVKTFLEPAYDDLRLGSRDPLPPLHDLLIALPHWITATQVRVVNSETPEASDIVWDTAPSWILIGGNKLDRGFTVEGLVVTYMPRSVGVGNIDTIQQRARFFGYKDGYKELCRAWLDSGIADALTHYVDHEEHLRSDLITVDKDGANLGKWTRRMLIDSQFKPTRRTVIDLPYLHGKFRGDSWESIGRLARLGKLAAANRTAVDHLRAAYASSTYPVVLDPRSVKHEQFSVAIDTAISLLLDWNGDPADTVLLKQLVLLLQFKFDSDPSLEADIFLMDQLQTRRRSLRVDQVTVNNLQQGASPNGAYPGDKAIYLPGRLAIQIHNVASQPGDPVWDGLGLSLRLPSELSGGALLQVDEE